VAHQYNLERHYKVTRYTAGYVSDDVELVVVSDVSLVPLLLRLSFLSLLPIALVVEWLLARLSEMYQPEPLKTMPTGWKTRRTAPAHDGHVRSGSSLKDWNCSN
jgi:hypothetical protein